MIHYQTGDEVALKIDRQGICNNDGIAHLPDETMVVILGAGAQVGETVEAIITGKLQTSLGDSLIASAKM